MIPNACTSRLIALRIGFRCALKTLQTLDGAGYLAVAFKGRALGEFKGAL